MIFSKWYKITIQNRVKMHESTRISLLTGDNVFLDSDFVPFFENRWILDEKYTNGKKWSPLEVIDFYCFYIKWWYKITSTLKYPPMYIFTPFVYKLQYIERRILFFISSNIFTIGFLFTIDKKRNNYMHRGVVQRKSENVPFMKR